MKHKNGQIPDIVWHQCSCEQNIFTITNSITNKNKYQDEMYNQLFRTHCIFWNLYPLIILKRNSKNCCL